MIAPCTGPLSTFLCSPGLGSLLIVPTIGSDTGRPGSQPDGPVISSDPSHVSSIVMMEGDSYLRICHNHRDAEDSSGQARKREGWLQSRYYAILFPRCNLKRSDQREGGGTRYRWHTEAGTRPPRNGIRDTALGFGVLVGFGLGRGRL